MFFSECFLLKYWNVLGLKYDLTMMTFKLIHELKHFRSRLPQTFTSMWFFLFHFGKWWILRQNWFCFLVQNRAAFCLVRFLPQKHCGMLTRRYHSKTPRYRLRNEDQIFSLNINPWLYIVQAFPFSGFCFYPVSVAKRQRGEILVSIESSFYA